MFEPISSSYFKLSLTTIVLNLMKGCELKNQNRWKVHYSKINVIITILTIQNSWRFPFNTKF